MLVSEYLSIALLLHYNTSKPKQTICKAEQGIPLTSRLAKLAKLWAVFLTVTLHRSEREKYHQECSRLSLTSEMR